jgi:2-iminobutanoate/2-iminopropanoate deaminase
MITISNPDSVAPPVGSYSHLAIVKAGTDLLFVAGQVGMRPDGSVPVDVNEQYRQSLKNILAILASEGCGSDDIVKLNTFVVEPLSLESIREIRLELLGKSKPPSTLIYVPNLASPEFLVEIEAIAARAAQKGSPN